MSREAVILFSHGSLLCGAGEALNVHADRLKKEGLAPIVEVGYLNYSEPLFAETVDKVAALGAVRILVTPYFLISGKFVQTDLPEAIAAAQAAHPELEFVVAEAIGYDDRLADALLQSAALAGGPDTWRVELARASRSCRLNPQCPLYGTEACRSGVLGKVGDG